MLRPPEKGGNMEKQLKVEHDLDRSLTMCNSCAHAVSNLVEGSLYSDCCSSTESAYCAGGPTDLVYFTAVVF